MPGSLTDPLACYQTDADEQDGIVKEKLELRRRRFLDSCLKLLNNRWKDDTGIPLGIADVVIALKDLFRDNKSGGVQTDQPVPRLLQLLDLLFHADPAKSDSRLQRPSYGVPGNGMVICSVDPRVLAGVFVHLLFQSDKGWSTQISITNTSTAIVFTLNTRCPEQLIREFDLVQVHANITVAYDDVLPDMTIITLPIQFN